jgi:hypothetical protein
MNSTICRTPRVVNPARVGASLITLALIAWLLPGCSNDPASQAKVDAALTSVPGQLFCQFESNGHAQIVGGIIATAAGGAAGVAGPAVNQGVVLATNATAAAAQSACTLAAAKVGAIAAKPVAPPSDPSAVVKVPIDVAKLPAA